MAENNTKVKEKKVKPVKETKPKKKKTKKTEEPTPILIEEDITDNLLPQNILPMGERVDEKKNIYISQRVYRQINKFTNGKTLNEAGGVLVGTVMEELGKTNILISGFIEAKHSQATPTTLTFTHETWEYIHDQMDKRFPGKKIVGWIHTHPDFGIFLSDYDKFIHENFFGEPYQIAYVIDPVQNVEGFYFWIENKLEKCPGFYIYDKTGVDISINKEENKELVAPAEEKQGFSVKNLIIGILVAAVVILSITTVSLAGRINKLEKDFERRVQETVMKMFFNAQFSNSQQFDDDTSSEVSDNEESSDQETESKTQNDEGENQGE